MMNIEHPSFQKKVISDPQECDLSLKIPLSKYNSSTDLREVFLLHNPVSSWRKRQYFRKYMFTYYGLVFQFLKYTSSAHLQKRWEVNATTLE